MLEGPYRSWYHLHVFTPVAHGVEMYDRVEYEMPFGPLGSAAHRLLVRRQLDAIFDFRARAVSARFGAGNERHTYEPEGGSDAATPAVAAERW
jgi:ligand-binding SRPBCC domain-containing protein